MYDEDFRYIKYQKGYQGTTWAGRTVSFHSWTLFLTAFLLMIINPACEKEDLLDQGIVVIGLESKPTNLDPRLSTDAASSRINQLIFNRLFRKDINGRPAKDLVQEWEQLDEVTYRFRVHKGVRFHDGRSLDARDVQYTFQSLLDPSLGSPLRGSYQMISSMECPDPHTIIFHLKEAHASFLVSLDLGILPRPLKGHPEKDVGSHPMGTGPFSFKAWDQGSRIILRANKDYFRGTPNIDEVHFKVVPDNTVRVLELKKGSVHLLQNDIEPEVLRVLEKEPRLMIRQCEGTNYSYLGFNLRDPVLSSLEVRKAIAHAIDRKMIIKYLLGGLAIPARGVLSPINWAYNPDVPIYNYDPGKAKRLLDKAGFPDPDGDGPGTRFSLTYKTSQNALRQRVGEAIQSQLGEIGIDVKIRSFEWGTFFSDIKKGNFQIYTLTWVGITDPDIFYYLFHTKSIPPDGANRGFYRNPEIDRLLVRARLVQDIKERKKIYGRVQRILAIDLPYMSLWYSRNVVVNDRRIKGFKLYPDGNMRSLKDVWIE